MNRCIIFSGSPAFDPASVEDIDFSRYYIIAVDAGIGNAEKCGIKPRLVLGDFDSFEYNEKSGYQIIKYPVEKDYTDTQLAAMKAVELSFDEVIIVGALGGRIDHSLANINTLRYLNSHNIKSKIIDNRTEIFVLSSGKHKISKKDSFQVSLFSLTEAVRGLTLRGFKYPLLNYTLYSSDSIGISNEIAGDYGELEFESGEILVINTRD